jgi:hypothetical protein
MVSWWRWEVVEGLQAAACRSELRGGRRPADDQRRWSGGARPASRNERGEEAERSRLFSTLVRYARKDGLYPGPNPKSIRVSGQKYC